MLHIIYIFAFTIIAILAITNLIRSLVTLSTDTQRMYPANANLSPSAQINHKNSFCYENNSSRIAR